MQGRRRKAGSPGVPGGWGVAGENQSLTKVGWGKGKDESLSNGLMNK